MQTTDLHAHVFPFDYFNDHPVDALGLARTASLITSIRAETQNSLLLDNGDFLQGSAMADYMAFDRGLKDGDTHPIIAAMNTLGYDAASLGNHEFNFGIPFMMASLAASNFPVISANVLVERGANARKDKRLLAPYILLDRYIRDGTGTRHPIRIGVLGLLPPQIEVWDQIHLGGKLTTRCMIETAEQLIPEMKDAGADIIIALAHTGIGGAQRVEGMENAALPLARLAGLDALITGHTHQVFPGPQFATTPEADLTRGTLAQTPTVMAGFWGSHLGLIDLLLERDGKSWRVIDACAEARPIAQLGPKGIPLPLVSPAPRVLRATKMYHAATLDYMRSQVGETKYPIYSYFSMLKTCPSVQLVCEAQREFVAEKLAGGPFEDLPLLSAASPFKVGGRTGPENYTDIPAGPLYQRSLASLYCFPNTICAIMVQGAALVEWLERSAAAFNTMTPGKADQPLINMDMPSYNFDVIFGLTYEIDPSQPPRYATDGRLIDAGARRVRNICYLGKPLDLKARFVVATNSYRLGTQSAFEEMAGAKVVLQRSVTIRTVLFNYISKHSPLALHAAPNWTLVMLPDTSYTFECAPRAAEFVDSVTGMSIEPLELGKNGFQRFRVVA